MSGTKMSEPFTEAYAKASGEAVTFEALTEQEKKLAARVLWAIWEECASDIFAACEDGGEPAVLPRDHVIEIALDADRAYALAEEEVRRAARQWPLANRDATKVQALWDAAKVARFFKEASYEDQKLVGLLAFTASRYGR